MKESITSPYPKCIFREVFLDEATVRRNGGTPTDVDFSQGKGSLNGSTSKINYNLTLNGTYSVRIKCKPIISGITSVLFDCRGSNDDGVGYIDRISNLIGKSSGTVYLNGVIGANSITDANNDVVVTGMTLRQGTGANLSVFGTRFTNNFYFVADIDLIEIYQGTLTASEVANLYNNTWNKELSPNNLLLDFDSTNGVLDLGDYTNTATATDVTIKKTGQSYSASFNGTTSKIDTGSDFIGTKAVTVCGWIKPYSWGESTFGRIIDNNYFYFYLYGTGGFAYQSLRISSNGSIEVRSEINSISLNKWQFISVTRTASGVVNFYIGEVSNAPALSGTANQTSGTPTAGTTNVIIGNNSGTTRTFDGNISELKIIEGILDIQTITQIWSESRKNYI